MIRHLLPLALLTLAPAGLRAQDVLDRSFGEGGLARLSLTYEQPVATSASALVVGANGRTPTLGSATARFDSDGRLDPTFGDGRVRYEPLPGVAAATVGAGYVSV